jgi:tetratricopeptide (TPR) repeat protein
MGSIHNSSQVFMDALCSRLRFCIMNINDEGQELEVSFDAVIAKALQLLANGDIDALKEMSSDLEGLHPTTQEQWQSAVKTFTGLNRKAWVEIMTRRFLEQEPGNLSAKILEISILKDVPSKFDEAFSKLRSLPEEGITDITNLLDIFSLYRRFGRSDEGFRYLKRATALSPTDPRVLHHRIDYYIKREEYNEAKEDLISLESLSSDRPTMLVYVYDFALRMKDLSFAQRVLRRAIDNVNPNDIDAVVKLLSRCSTVAHIDWLSELASSIDVTKITDLRKIDDVYAAIEGHGLFEVERTLNERAKALGSTRHSEDVSFPGLGPAVNETASRRATAQRRQGRTESPITSHVVNRIRDFFARRKD